MLTTEEQRLRDVLISCARQRRLISYSDVCTAARLPLDMANPDHRNQIASMLARVSQYEAEHFRPMLSVLVVKRALQIPGKGFYTFAVELGLLPDRSNQADRLSFFAQQVRDVQNTWAA